MPAVAEPRATAMRWDTTLREATAAVVVELGTRFEPAEITDWLLTPHPLLGDRVPLDLLPGCVECCRQAARVDRFVRHG